jgi:hypothetical protein
MTGFVDHPMRLVGRSKAHKFLKMFDCREWLVEVVKQLPPFLILG